MKAKVLYPAIAAFAFATAFMSCDDNTDTLGSDMMPYEDLITKESKSYDVYTQSYSAGDSVLARSSMSYLGQFTDPETGTVIKSDFLAQFHCIEDFSFPDSIVDDSILSTQLRLFVDDFIGDSLATFKVSVYPLTTVLDPDADYYTNIDPTKYCDVSSEPLTVKWYTLSDRTIEESERTSSSYVNRIVIPLPNEIGKEIYSAWKTHPECFKDSESWINSGLPGCKGFYFKLESGDGAMAYIDIAQFNINYRYHDSTYDTDTTGTCQFAATEEVVQATRFENSSLTELIGDDEATYLKSPAGIFTMATLPVSELDYNDTINQAKLVLTRYNDKVDSSFKLDIPKTILMVRLDDYNDGFFEQYKVADDNTSYLASFSSKTNTYTFSNIARLMNTIHQEVRNGTATENYNKVLFIPVEPTYETATSSSSKKTLVKLSHSFSMSSAKLVGGKNSPVKLDVIYSRFK